MAAPPGTMVLRLEFLSWEQILLQITTETEKAKLWQRDLEHILLVNRCAPATANQMVGRLTWTCSISSGRVGRAYWEPFHAQGNKPPSSGHLTPWLASAAGWFIRYMDMEPMTTYRVPEGDGQTCRNWKDASGASRMMAALLLIDGRFLRTRMDVP